MVHFRQLFFPESVAVIGASHQRGSVGNELVENLTKHGYRGRVYAINPKGGDLFGLRVKKSLSEVRGKVELAVIAVPAKIVPSVLVECGQHQVKAAIVLSAGFKEVGNFQLEKEIAQIAHRYNITLIGPNCLGSITPALHLNASFAPSIPRSGEIAFFSQSGAICASILDYAEQRQLGFSKFISVGNSAVVSELELLEYLYKDPDTKVILAYVEQLTHAKQLVRLARQMVKNHRPKPVIVLKSGRTSAGAQASSSHTGSLAGSDAAYQALFAQAGMIRAESIAELFDFAEVFTRAKPPRDCRVAVVTNAGGPGVLSADALIEAELCLAEIAPATQQRLKSFLPAAASVKNPIDILGDAPAERYQQTLEVLLADPGVDAIQIILTPQAMTEVTATARAIVAIRAKTAKPLIVTFMGQERVERGVKLLHEGKVATTWFPEPASRALAALSEWRSWLQTVDTKVITTTQDGVRLTRQFHFPDFKERTIERSIAAADSGQWLASDVSYRLLKAAGLPMLAHQVVQTASEARQVAKEWGTPVVLKIVSPDITHKTEAGGVMLDVHPSDVASAYNQLLETVQERAPQARLVGVELMPHHTEPGVELLLGVMTDPQLGKTVAVGQGGIYTELYKDVAWGLVPVTPLDAWHMVHQLKIAEVLKGWRGQSPAEIACVVECIGRLSVLVNRFPQIQELDLNPLKVLPKGKGGVILDARIKVR